MAIGTRVIVPPLETVLLVTGKQKKVFIRSKTVLQIGGADCELNYFLSSKDIMDLGILDIGEQIFGFNPSGTVNVEVSVMEIENVLPIGDL